MLVKPYIELPNIAFRVSFCYVNEIITPFNE
jgi:hypothetical protein